MSFTYVNNTCDKLQLHDAIYRLRFYSHSLIHILSLSKSHNNVASSQKNRADKLHRVIVAIDKFRVAEVMKNKLRSQRGVYFSLLRPRGVYQACPDVLFVSHKDFPSLVTLKRGKVRLLG